MSDLRMRQDDDANDVEEASYESHCVYAGLLLLSTVVGSCYSSSSILK